MGARARSCSSAAPGAGKTRPALVLARELLARGRRARASHVVCPTTPLTRQWAEAAGAPRPPARARRRRAAPAARLRRRRRRPTRASPRRPRAGRRSAARARSSSPTRRTTSATSSPGARASRAAFARDAGAGCCCRARRFAPTPRAIPGVRYDATASRVPDVSYTLRRRRPRRHLPAGRRSSPTTARCPGSRGDDVIESSFDDVAQRRARPSRRYRTAISTELPDGLPRILRAAHERLERAARRRPPRRRRARRHRRRRARARASRRCCARSPARAPVVVLHTDARAAAQAARVRARRATRWIVAVNMVSEGVDIPRLRVGVYATAAKTPLIFRQIVGRFVRTIAGRPAEQSWLYLPADRLLRAHAADVETRAAPRAARAAARTDSALLDEPPTRARDRARPSPRRSSRSPPTSRRSSRCSAAARRRRAGRRRRAARPPRRAPAPTSRAGARPSSAARACATSATASCATLRRLRRALARARSTRWLNRADRRRPRRRRDDRAARALDRAAARRADAPLG